MKLIPKYYKLIYTLVFCCLLFISNSQNDTKLKYKADGIYLVFNDMNTLKQISEIPYGKDVELTYDDFFKSWIIRFTDKNGERTPIKFEYLKSNPDGSFEMKDTHGNWFTCYNKINTKKELIFVSNKIENDMINTLKVMNITLIK